MKLIHKLLTFVLLLLISNSSQADYVSSTPKTSVATASTEITQLQADGNDIFVEQFENYQFAHFVFENKTRVTLTAKENISSFSIHPLAYNVKGTAKGKKLSFDLTHLPNKPMYLLIKINKLGHLALLGDKPQKNKPNPRDRKVFDITKSPYNADNTNSKDVTSIIQKALDKISASGGGILYFPPGVYKVRETIRARSNISMYLEIGARIKSNPDTTLYKNSTLTDHMLRINEIENFKIFGYGMLDASGMAIMKRSNTTKRRKIIYGDMDAKTRNKNITVEGLLLHDATTWTCAIQKADNVLVQNVKVLNHWDQNDIKIQNDGINLNSCRHGTVHANFIITGDDAMCSKAQEEKEETAHLTYSHNVVFNMGAGNKTGMNVRGPMHDILFTDTQVISCRRGIAMDATTSENPTPVDGVIFKNITVESYQGYNKYEKKLVQFEAKKAPLRNVRIINLNSLVASPDNQSIYGKEGVSDVIFKGLVIAGKEILDAKAGDFSIRDGAEVTFEKAPN